MIETNRIEFKRELTRELDIEREVVAFLNYREGGILYIGVDDDGHPIGVSDIDGDVLRVKDRIRNGISPSPMGLFDVTIEHIDGIPVIKVFVASGTEKPYYKTKYGMSERGCYIRVGTAAEPMSTKQIEDLFSHRVHNSIRNIPSPRQDLTFNQLRTYSRDHFTFGDNYIRLTIPYYTETATTDVAENVAEGLTERQSLIMDMIRKGVAENVAVNTKVLSERMEVNRKTIQRDLSVLQDKNLIEWIGSAKGGHWTPSDNNR